jgi:hypothetical protein
MTVIALVLGETQRRREGSVEGKDSEKDGVEELIPID